MTSGSWSGDRFDFEGWAGPDHNIAARPLGRVDHVTEVPAATLVASGHHQLEVFGTQGPPQRPDVTP